MRNAEKSTCSAVGNPFEFFLEARISKSISNFASRERIGKPAFLITRMAQSRRENINFSPPKSLCCGVQCPSHHRPRFQFPYPIIDRDLRLVDLPLRWPTVQYAGECYSDVAARF